MLYWASLMFDKLYIFWRCLNTFHNKTHILNRQQSTLLLDKVNMSLDTDIPLLASLSLYVVPLLWFLLDCFTPYQCPSVFPVIIVFTIKVSQKGGLFIFWCHSILLAAHSVIELGTNGYYSERWDPFGGLSGLRVVWKLVSVDPWPSPAESQCASFYGNSNYLPAASRRVSPPE